jgi:hypothetical protein
VAASMRGLGGASRRAFAPRSAATCVPAYQAHTACACVPTRTTRHS